MSESKSYYEHMKGISKDDLMEGLFLNGFFAEQLPPIFQVQEFYNLYKSDYDESENNYITTHNIPSKNIIFETMRNINIPRVINIPNPFGYFNQCLCLRESWDYIKNHFQINTLRNDFKISLNHLRKSENTKKLINAKTYIYKDSETGMIRKKNRYFDKDNSFKLKLLSKYKVELDISRCFPSIYTHSISWALVGKQRAKRESNKKYKNEYFNKIDEYTRKLNDGETYGIMIGPHSSNLISEIILVKIDSKLSKKWTYTRYIDDYTCYVSSEKEAQEFIIDVTDKLRKYNLSINHRKTKITKLPEVTDNWVHKMQNFTPFLIKKINTNSKINFIEIKAYLEMAKELALKESNSAVLNYGIKVVSSLNLTYNAKEQFIYEVFNLAYIYPYLIPLLDKEIIEMYKNSFFNSKKGLKVLEKVLNELYLENLKQMNFEAVSYILYYCLKYNIELESIEFNNFKKSGSTIVYLLGYLYSKRYPNVNNTKEDYEKLARSICDLDSSNKVIDKFNDGFQENWLFVYEVLSSDNFEDDWARIKKNNISFLKEEYNYG